MRAIYSVVAISSVVAGLDEAVVQGCGALCHNTFPSRRPFHFHQANAARGSRRQITDTITRKVYNLGYTDNMHKA